MTEERLRIRSYLQAQGAKLSPAEIIDRVRAAMEQLRATALTVPAGRVNARPAAEEWSANEVMAHVVSANERVAERIVTVLDGGAPRGPIRDVLERGVPELTVDEWWSSLTQAREALFTRVLRADPAEHPEPIIEHPFFGPLTWREAVLFLRLHDLDHAGQLGKIVAALAALPGH